MLCAVPAPATGKRRTNGLCLPSHHAGTSHKPCRLVAAATRRQQARRLPADAEAMLVASHYGLGRERRLQRLLLALGDNLLVSDDGRSRGRLADQPPQQQQQQQQWHQVVDGWLYVVYSTYARCVPEDGAPVTGASHQRKRQLRSTVGWLSTFVGHNT